MEMIKTGIYSQLSGPQDAVHSSARQPELEERRNIGDIGGAHLSLSLDQEAETTPLELVWATFSPEQQRSVEKQLALMIQSAAEERKWAVITPEDDRREQPI